MESRTFTTLLVWTANIVATEKVVYNSSQEAAQNNNNNPDNFIFDRVADSVYQHVDLECQGCQGNDVIEWGGWGIHMLSIALSKIW